MRFLALLAIICEVTGSLIAPSRSVHRTIISSPVRLDLLKSSDGFSKITIQQPKKQHALRNIPNLMSIGRMVAIPVFLGLRFSDQVCCLLALLDISFREHSPKGFLLFHLYLIIWMGSSLGDIT
jgi:hypothetical protein